MVSVLFALLTALFNGLASVLQRIAASTAPASKALHLSLLGYLVKHRVWLAGIAMVVVAAVCQAIALATGPVALVQRAADLLAQSSEESLSLRQLAQTLGATQSTLRRAFLPVTGLKPRELAEAHRLKRHRRSLRNRLRLVQPRL